MRWSTADIADALDAGFRSRAASDDLEQAVYGFDALDELGLHEVIRDSLRDEGYGVWPEQRYPDDRNKRKKSEGKRCDLVLTEDGMPLREPEVADTLFDQTPAVDPSAAYWLEVKLVAQFEKSGPFGRYSAELLSPVTKDVRKLWSDSGIHHAGLLLVLFTADQHTAEHDLMVWHNRALERGFPVGVPTLRGLKLTDRIGNGWCSIAVFGVRGW